jgi:DNA repair exonuclease SbcCD ATPase subunit
VEASQREWISLFQELLSSPERTELAADVGELLRQKGLTGARQRLEAAVNAGTLAIIIGDSIQDPELQKLLQAVARERQDTRLAQGIPVADAGANGGKVGEPGDAAEKERVRAEAALQELHAVQEQLAALREKEARVVELEHKLEQEKGRTASVIQDLSLVRGQLIAMTQNAIRAAETRDEHAREVEKGKAASLELTAKLAQAQEQLVLLKGGAAEAAELRPALERERDAVKSAARELEALRRELVTLQTNAVSSAGAVSSAAQENERADATSQQLKAVQEQLSALRESEAKMQDVLKQERERSASAIRQLGASQREVLALKAQAASAAKIQEALRQEKENTAAAIRDVHALKRQIADLGAHTEFVPAALLFQTVPVLLKPSTHTFQSGAKPSSGAGTDGDISQRKARQVSLPPQAERERKLFDEATAQTRRRNLQLKSVEKSVRPPSTRSKPSEAAGRDIVVKLKRSPRLPVANSAPEPLAPNLPAILLPIDGLWALY